MTDFDLKIGLTPDSQPDAQDQADAMLAMVEALKDPDKAAALSRKSNEFGRFMTRGGMALRDRAYPSDLEPVKITKVLDKSSLTLFGACVAGTYIDQAILIKRRGGGADALQTYLRVVFTGVLITDFNWDEGPVIKESFTFVCRKAEVRYSVENDDGTLKAPLPVRTWSRQEQPG